MTFFCWCDAQGYGTGQIDRLVTLGSPHKAPPKVDFLNNREAFTCTVLPGRVLPFSCLVARLGQHLGGQYFKDLVGLQDKGLVDQTRGILTWVTNNCPDNYHKEIGYATVSA